MENLKHSLRHLNTVERLRRLSVEKAKRGLALANYEHEKAQGQYQIAKALFEQELSAQKNQRGTGLLIDPLRWEFNLSHVDKLAEQMSNALTEKNTCAQEMRNANVRLTTQNVLHKVIEKGIEKCGKKIDAQNLHEQYMEIQDGQIALNSVIS